MSTTAIAAASVAIAASAANQANNAQRTVECNRIVDRFEPQYATVQEQKQYADCIDFLHPDPVFTESVWFIKAVIICGLIGLVVGLVRSVLNKWNDLVDHFWFSACGFAIGLTTPFILALFVMAIKFLFS